MRASGWALRAAASQLVGGPFHRVAAAKIEHDAAGLGLVQDVGRADFQHDRKANGLGRRCGLGRGRDVAAFRQGDAVFARASSSRVAGERSLAGAGGGIVRPLSTPRGVKPERIHGAQA